MVGVEMGSTSYLKPKSGGYRAKSGSSGGSDKEMNGKLRRPKIRRPTKLNDYGLKRIPDYTELAYKEAVSKLRYFLSGNYVPSVRSYGGSASIKNLDESDGELEKKYNLATSAPYNALLEYKPRPRLTAKYATLYADSLNNTHTKQHVSAPAPAAANADVTGGTNPDVINFIQKQEEYIEQLERESQYCRDELNNLLGKVKEVISENEHLHEAQKNKLINRMFHSYAGSETDELDDLGDSTGLDSDNKVTPSKARKSKPRSTRLEGPNIVFESRIAELEAQLTQAKIDLKKVQEENNENKRKLASGLVDSTCLDGFKRQIDNLQRDKSSLEAQISKLKLSLESRDGEYRRGSDAVEQQLRDERNNLEAELRRLKDDLTKERSKVRELAGEGARRAIQERSAAEQRYNAHFDELQHDLAAQYDNVAKLQLDLERQRREENDLKRELSMKTAAIEELKMELKNKTASLQADLAQAHAEKASLEEELASARLAIERHQRQAKHETNRLNSEIQSLRQRLDRADADLVHSRRENLRLTEQISTLEKELNMKNLTPNSPEKKKDKELSTMFESMENKHAKTVAELESMIQSQNSLMEKLTGECRLLTDKLDDANRRHKAQSRGRSDEPIRTQRDRSRSRDRPIPSRRTKRRSEKESDSSNNYPPIVVGPVTTNQDLDVKGEKVFNLPLMIQQPFLREKKEPIKVDISVKLIPKPRKKEKKKREARVEEIVIHSDENKGVKNTLSMEVTKDNVQLLKTSIEPIEAEEANSTETEAKEDSIEGPNVALTDIPPSTTEVKCEPILEQEKEIVQEASTVQDVAAVESAPLETNTMETSEPVIEAKEEQIEVAQENTEQTEATESDVKEETETQNVEQPEDIENT
ncbi:serologically defined colon cancer antigen 8 homolog isoform X2 [Pectinophora gossypiella]|uniref:serologically defined colon cancer antigen 8 homolog isoform X2 n=1 Tax=Pectinophora gossypiella TaxID=13191 RepID=UPI00214E9E8A|nr:serologically defined colon cancer antigen 8 homolog isoform X2 [Pectinophora gossypiella]